MSDTPGWSRPDDAERPSPPASQPPASPPPPVGPPPAPAAPTAPTTSSAPTAPTPPAPVPSGWSAVQPPPAPGWYGPQGGWGGQQAPPGQPGQQPGQWPGQQPGWAGWVSQRPPEVKPGVIPLRPLGIGEILDGAITTMRRHWNSRAVLGEEISLADAWSRARGRLLPLLGLSVLLVLLFGGVLLAGLVPGLLALALGLGTPGAVALFVLGILGAVPLVIYLYVTYALSAAALMLERQPVLAALGRSRRLVRGSWWRVFGVLLLGTIIATVIGQIISIPFGFASIFTYDAGNPNAIPGLPYFALNTLGASIAGTITYPFSAGVAVLLYVDLRMRREALDLELARAAGVTLPGAPGGPGGPSPAGPVPPDQPRAPSNW